MVWLATTISAAKTTIRMSPRSALRLSSSVMLRVIPATKLASTARAKMNIETRTGRPAPEGMIRPTIQEITYQSRMPSAMMFAGVPTPPIGAKTRLDGMSSSSTR